MEYNSFLKKIIDDGIEAVKRDYADSPEKAKGAVEGFEACRDKQPHELLQLLLDSNRRAGEAHFNADIDKYWELRCFALEVEWTCNCVSAALLSNNLPIITHPTARGVIKAAEILNN